MVGQANGDLLCAVAVLIVMFPGTETRIRMAILPWMRRMSGKHPILITLVNIHSSMTMAMVWEATLLIRQPMTVLVRIQPRMAFMVSSIP